MHRSQINRLRQELGMPSYHTPNLCWDDGQPKTEDDMVIEGLLLEIRDLQNNVKVLTETVSRLVS
ncbi:MULTISPECIES: hypothetical protein [Cyanophyceae]|uniref:hypothetical protein n=1 Tax=Cyanophyceae TaxID=3028117 RepID=UPI001688C794|nr:hypothetical protein [Trichocoleus sp. FACHB-40]MBD2006319.1 hypothetical protein [Trichocoleus sp. FACHB-40]